VDQFIEALDVLIVPSDPDENWGVLPRLLCLWCGNEIYGDMEQEYLWIHDGNGVDLRDPFITFVVNRIRELHPDWKLRSVCKTCNEELTFLEQHSCRESANPF